MAKGKPHKVNAWEMIRDVLVAGVNKGQVPQVTMALVCIVIVLKMPGQDVTALVQRLLDGAASGYYMGWILGLVACIGWGWHAKHIRSVTARELKRVAEERNKYQQRSLKGSILKSSSEQ